VLHPGAGSGSCGSSPSSSLSESLGSRLSQALAKLEKQRRHMTEETEKLEQAFLQEAQMVQELSRLTTQSGGAAEGGEVAGSRKRSRSLPAAAGTSGPRSSSSSDGAARNSQPERESAGSETAAASPTLCQIEAVLRDMAASAWAGCGAAASVTMGHKKRKGAHGAADVCESEESRCGSASSSASGSVGSSAPSSSSQWPTGPAKTVDLVHFNVMGERMSIRRSAIQTAAPDSALAARVSGRWTEQERDLDEDGNILMEEPEECFRAFLAYMRLRALRLELGLGGAEGSAADRIYVSAGLVKSMIRLLDYQTMQVPIFIHESVYHPATS